MIRTIVAIDNKRGMANDKGIPWHLPTDLEYYRSKTTKGAILMGYGTYVEFDHPFHDRLNYVALPEDMALRPGFKRVNDAREFLKAFKQDIWVIGGAGLIEATFDLIEELYITELDQDFHCTKFFPEYKKDFKLISTSKPQTENGITFRFAVYRRK